MTSTTSIQLQAGETLFDVAIKRYGHMQGLLNLIIDNDLGFTDEPKPGVVLEIDNSVSFKNLKKIKIATQVDELPNEAVVKARQNLFDMSLQIYGDLSGLIELAEDNDLNLTQELTPGTKLKSRIEVKNKQVVSFFKARKNKPATGLSISETEKLKPEGIDYWAIEYDFVVS